MPVKIIYTTGGKLIIIQTVWWEEVFAGDDSFNIATTWAFYLVGNIVHLSYFTLVLFPPPLAHTF